MEVIGLMNYDLFPYIATRRGELTERSGVRVPHQGVYTPFATLPVQEGERLEDSLRELKKQYLHESEALQAKYIAMRDELLKAHQVERMPEYPKAK